MGPSHRSILLVYQSAWAGIQVRLFFSLRFKVERGPSIFMWRQFCGHTSTGIANGFSCVLSSYQVISGILGGGSRRKAGCLADGEHEACFPGKQS